MVNLHALLLLNFALRDFYIMSETLELASKLIACNSVTPNDAGCQDLLEQELKEVGFKCRTLREGMYPTFNLLALHSVDPKANFEGDPAILKNNPGPYDASGFVAPGPFTIFLGHTDVVPAKESDWNSDPFSPTIKDGVLYGRGAADMKGSDAAMTIALKNFVKKHPNYKGTIGLLMTSNEEGDAVGGIPFVAEWLKKERLYPDFCIVGEPSSSKTFGDIIKIGRRGSMTAHITINGKQGHVAYPEQIDNACHKGAQLIAALLEKPLDNGNEDFPPTSFNVTNFNSGVGAENVAPGTCQIMCNWRFSPLQTPVKLQRRLEKTMEELGIYATVRYVINGLPFISSKDGQLVTALKAAVEHHTKVTPDLNTLGGTSDGRFIAPLGTQVVEFGPINATIHKANECVNVEDLETLTKIYEDALEKLHL